MGFDAGQRVLREHACTSISEEQSNNNIDHDDIVKCKYSHCRHKFFVGSNFSIRCSTKPEEICGLGEGSCSQNDHCGEDDDGTDDLDLAGGDGDADADPDGLIEILDCFRGRSSL